MLNNRQNPSKTIWEDADVFDYELAREATEKNFSKLLNNESLNSIQIDFVNNIVNYIVQNGCIEKKVL